MERLLDSLRRSLQAGAAGAADKAEELSRRGRARLDIAAVQTRISRLHAQLGEAALASIEAGHIAALTQDPEVVGLCTTLQQLKEELAARQHALEDLRRAFERASAPPPPPSAPPESPV